MEKSERIWLDGVLVPWDAAQVHVLTHTLHYGLGVFEGIRCYACHDGRSAIFRLREHIDRLYGPAHALELHVPYPRTELLEAWVETVRTSRLPERDIRPLVFLGGGVRRGALATGLRCITRRGGLGLHADLGVTARGERFTRAEICLADGAFLTGTAAEGPPLRELDDRRVGNGTPGPLTRQLHDL